MASFFKFVGALGLGQGIILSLLAKKYQLLMIREVHENTLRLGDKKAIDPLGEEDRIPYPA